MPPRSALLASCSVLLAPCLAALAQNAAAAGALSEPVVSVSDDGRLSVHEEPGRPTGLLFKADEVPLSSSPDWAADSVRAIGGIRFADVDGDGDLDMVLGCYQQTGFPAINEYQNMIHFNTGGALETDASWVTSAKRHTADVQVADVNDDGYPDLFFANGGQSQQPSTLYFGGPGGPSTTADWVAADVNWTVGGALADVNGDGNIDLIKANQGVNPIYDRPVHVFYGDGTTLATTPGWQSTDTALSNTAAAVDLDGSSEVTVNAYAFAADGTQRVFQLPQSWLRTVTRVEVVPGPTPSHVVYREAGFIQFTSPPAAGSSVEVDYVYPQYPDLCFSRWVNYASCVYGNFAGFIPGTPTQTVVAASESDRGFMFSDVDGDGDLDAAIGNASSPTALYDNAAGTLSGPVWAADTSLYFSTQDMACCDVDGDGDEDLATVNFGGGVVRVFLNRNGVMDTLPAWAYTLSSSGSAVGWGDVNGDGYLDLATGSARGPAEVFLNQGPSGLDAPAVAAGGGTPGRLAATPNPFLASTAITGIAPDGGDVEIFDLLGRFVARVPAGTGAERVSWDGRDESGSRVAAGVYLVRQVSADEVRTGRVVRVR